MLLQQVLFIFDVFFFCRPYVVHDSPAILLVRNNKYNMHLEAIKEWYLHRYHNWYTVNGARNCWYVFEQAKKVAIDSALQIQQYLLRVTEGKDFIVSWLSHFLTMHMHFECAKLDLS